MILLVVRFNLTIFEYSFDGNERAVCIDFSKCDMIFEKKCDRSAGASEEKSICLLFLLFGVGFLMLVTFGFEIWLVVTGDCLRPLRFVEIDRRQRVVPWNRIPKSEMQSEMLYLQTRRDSHVSAIQLETLRTPNRIVQFCFPQNGGRVLSCGGVLGDARVRPVHASGVPAALRVGGADLGRGHVHPSARAF